MYPDLLNDFKDYINETVSAINSSLFESWESAKNEQINLFSHKLPNFNIHIDSNFKANLFSNKFLDEFKKSSNIAENEILKISYALRNLNVNFATSSAFVESVNSSHPIDGKEKDTDYNRIYRIFKNQIIPPLGKHINQASNAVFIGSACDFCLRLARGESVNSFIFIWILIISMLFNLSTDKFTDKD